MRTAADGRVCEGGLDARANSVVDGAEPGPDWTLAVAGGRVEEWAPGRHGAADLECRLTLADAWHLHAGDVDGTGALRRLRVAAPDGSTGDHAPSPMDLGEQPELDDLPAIPGATLDVQYRYWAGPWGPVEFGVSFHDGRVSSMVLGELDEPDVGVWCTFFQMAQVRRGGIGVLDVLADGGQLDGPEGALALLAGLSESPEFRRAEAACGPSGYVLGVLGQYHEDVLAPACATVMADTAGPPGAT